MQYQIVLGRNAGFFSNVFSALGAVEWCAQNDTVPAVRFDQGAYVDPTKGPNWWEYYFQRLSDVDPMSLPIDSRVELMEQSVLFAKRIVTRRHIAAQLIRKHIVIHQELFEGLDTFWKRRIGDRFAIGLHLRGTDKFLEHPPPDLEVVFDQIEQLALGRPDRSWRIFLATDEDRLLQQVKRHFGDQVVCQKVFRSADGQPLHHRIPEDAWKNGPNGNLPYPTAVRKPAYTIGFEALRDALLLSRSNVFLGSQSNLSYFVGANNLRLPWLHIDRTVPAWTEERQAKDDLIRELRQIVSDQEGVIRELRNASRRVHRGMIKTDNQIR